MAMHDVEKQVLVEKLYAQCWEYYCHSVYGAMISQNSLKPCKLVFICKGIGAAGRFYVRHRLYGVPVVEINTAYYNGGMVTELQTTIAHEIAHYLQWKLFPSAVQWHGPEFRSIMQAIGYNGNTYHSMSKRVAVATAQRSKNDLFEF